jgi:hypothetical protein
MNKKIRDLTWLFAKMKEVSESSKVRYNHFGFIIEYYKGWIITYGNNMVKK